RCPSALLLSVLGSAATAGLTGATVMLTLTLSTLGLRLEGVGLLLAVDPIVDMGRTALNVTGQALVPVIVSKREQILDRPTYDAAPPTALQTLQAEQAQEAEQAVGDSAASGDGEPADDGTAADEDRSQPATV